MLELNTLTPYFGPVFGGTQINVIPDTCEIRVDRRLVPGEDPLQVLPAVEAHLDRLRAGPEHLEIEQDTPFLDTPLEPPFVPPLSFF